MKAVLQHEIKQSKPFLNLREELWLNLSRTASAVEHGMEKGLRAFGVSPTQYNVLRILRGAGPEGLCQYEIGERLVAQVPDVPRILDRMEKAGWITRVRATGDRRMVMTSLSPAGSQLVEQMDGPVEGMMTALFPALDEENMRILNDMLVEARR